MRRRVQGDFVKTLLVEDPAAGRFFHDFVQQDDTRVEERAELRAELQETRVQLDRFERALRERPT